MINIERLKRRMQAMAKIGKTERGGVTRLALSREDQEARQLFISWMEELGMKVRMDDVGNLYGRLEGKDPQAPVIMVGSHLDTVPKGGKFDGVLGVLGALEAVETLIKERVDHVHPIEVVSFTNEEGARFTPQMMGSGALTGVFTDNYVLNRADRDGLRFEDELRKIGFQGMRSHRSENISAFLELHIEQGPVLEAEQRSIGIVEGISGFYWMEVTILGQSDHSGSTPMSMRKDSLVTSSQIIQAIYQWALSRSDGTVATVGRIHTSPGIVNAVPGSTTFTVDIRHAKLEGLLECIQEVKQIIADLSYQNQMETFVEEIFTHHPVQFSPRVIDVIDRVCQEQQIPSMRMISGAGHDAMYLNRISDTAMIFVPSIDGKSHCEEEATSWEDIELGTRVLYETLCRLAK